MPVFRGIELQRQDGGIVAPLLGEKGMAEAPGAAAQGF